MFRLREPDYERSPATGMTRDHWRDAARWLLGRYMRHFDRRTETFLFPDSRTPEVVPNYETTPLPRRFESFARVFMLLGPTLAVEPDLTIDGLDMASCAARAIRRYTHPDSESYIGVPGEGKSPYQLVQWVGLIWGILFGGDGVWRLLGADGRAAALENLAACTHHRTNAHNWRWFNVLAAAFLHLNDVPFDAVAEREHLEHVLCWYAGDGWYRDGHDFDLYNAWAFQTYAAVWMTLPRSRAYPAIAEALRGRFAEFIATYPRMFSRRGESPMWGRSSLYRCAASGALVAAFLNGRPGISGGEARRIASGNVLQFLTRRDTFHRGVPTMGFYRTFPPGLQYYNAAGSFGWMHKTFLCLALPADGPFWTDTERCETWERTSEDPTVTHMPGPGLTVANFASNGTTVLVPGKVAATGDICYNRLAYHSSLLLEDDCADGATAMAYSAVNLDDPSRGVLTVSQYRYAGTRDGVLYRQIFLGEPGSHHSEGCLIDLADIFLPAGILRVDRVRTSFPYRLRLGSWGVPGTHAARRDHRFAVPTVIVDASSPEYATGIAMIRGWERVGVEHHRNLNAQSVESTIATLSRTAGTVNHGSIAICACLIFNGRGEPDDVPDVSVDHTPTGAGGPHTVTVTGRRGAAWSVDFAAIEGALSA